LPVQILFRRDELWIAIHENLHAFANFPAARRFQKRRFARAKTPRTPSPEKCISFAAFAPLREIFRLLVAALPRQVYAVKEGSE
jgi:hypothetical protein